MLSLAKPQSNEQKRFRHSKRRNARVEPYGEKRQMQKPCRHRRRLRTRDLPSRWRARDDALEHWALGVLGRLEAFDFDGLRGELTDEVFCHMDGRQMSVGVASTAKLLANVVAPTSAIYHDIRDIVARGSLVIMEMDVVVWWPGEARTTTAATMTLREHEGRLGEWRFYGWRDGCCPLRSRLSQGSVFDAATGVRAAAYDPMGRYFATPAGLAQMAEGYPPRWAIPGFDWERGPTVSANDCQDPIMKYRGRDNGNENA